MSVTHGGVLYYLVRVPPTKGDNEFDNPFRPDSDLSKEADHIVRLIKAGKPIDTPVDDIEPRIPSPDHTVIPLETIPDGSSPTRPTLNNVSPNNSPSYNQQDGGKVGANGNATTEHVTIVDPVEIQHGVVVPPSDASQVERVVMKKKPKTKCCVVM